jgi:hypothetical protein
VICISCSGVHRGLGTHVSFVRSCTLDKWRGDEIATVERVGNPRANPYWEANLPRGVRPPPDDLELMTKFIRQKYELAKWADPAGRPPHLLHRRHRRRSMQRQFAGSIRVLTRRARPSSVEQRVPLTRDQECKDVEIDTSCDVFASTANMGRTFVSDHRMRRTAII